MDHRLGHDLLLGGTAAEPADVRDHRGEPLGRAGGIPVQVRDEPVAQRHDELGVCRVGELGGEAPQPPEAVDVRGRGEGDHGVHGRERRRRMVEQTRRDG